MTDEEMTRLKNMLSALQINGNIEQLNLAMAQ